MSGHQLIVSKRNSDGTLGPATPYIIRAVDWSPASKTTNTSKSDPQNADVRRPEFGMWYRTDIPLMTAMNVNTVRMSIDPGFDATLGPIGLAILDELYRNGIMVIMTVDDGVNDMDRVQQAVGFYRDHPAILMWSLGNEWNIFLYFGKASSVLDAAQRTEDAAALIKSLDTNHHPVATSYGDIDIPGLSPLSDTQNYVNTVCPSVDVWSLNIYRGNTFGTVFAQWASITSKPMFAGEFGTDAFKTTSYPPLTCPLQGMVDEAAQAEWNLSLWDDLFRNLSARDLTKVALGGAVFEWNDEWWKVDPPGQYNVQDNCGHDQNPGGHPDQIANEEYFGIVDIDRHPRQVYTTLTTAFDPAYTPTPQVVTLRAVSAGSQVQGTNPCPTYSNGFAQFYMGSTQLFCRSGGAGGGRGFNVAVIDATTGNLLQPVENFDTWGTRDSGVAMYAMIDFLNALPNGTLVMLAVGDEAGLTQFPPPQSPCTLLTYPWVASGIQALEALGSTQIGSYCYRDSWAMIAVKGSGVLDEKRSPSATGAAASAQTTLTIP